jgi:hypothetical protein
MSASAININGAVAEVAKYITKAESFLSIPADQLIDVASVRRWARMFELLGDCRNKSNAEDAGRGREPDENAERYLDTKDLSSANLSSADGARREQMKEMLKGSRARSIPLRSRAVELFMLGKGEQFNEELTAHVADVRSYRRLMLADRFRLATFHTLGGGKWYGADSNPAQAFDAAQLYARRRDLADYLEENQEQIEAVGREAQSRWDETIRGRDDLERRFIASVSEYQDWFNWVNGNKRVDGRWVEDLEVTNEQRVARAEQWRLFQARKRRD